MSKNKRSGRILFPDSAPPSPRTVKTVLYIVLAVAVSMCAVCGLSVWAVAPRWNSPQQLLVFGAKGTEAGQFNRASYIGLDGDGNIYVADWDDGRINVFDSGGKYLRLIDLGANTVLLGMAIAPDGTVYASYDGKVHRLDTQGHDTTLAYSDSRGDLVADLSGIALGADGSLAAGDNRGDILRFGPDGTARLVLPSAFDLPSFSSRNEVHLNDGPILSYDVPANSADKNISMTVDGSGNIYAVGWTIGTVLKTDPAGNSLSKFGGFVFIPGGWQRGLFDFPDALAVDRHGRIYVGDANGVQVFDANEKYLYTISIDGGVNALALDSADNLYIVTSPYDHQLGALTERVIKLAAQLP